MLVKSGVCLLMWFLCDYLGAEQPGTNKRAPTTDLGLQISRIECRPVGVSDGRRMGTISKRQRKAKEAELDGVKSPGPRI